MLSMGRRDRQRCFLGNSTKPHIKVKQALTFLFIKKRDAEYIKSIRARLFKLKNTVRSYLTDALPV